MCSNVTTRCSVERNFTSANDLVLNDAPQCSAQRYGVDHCPTKREQMDGTNEAAAIFYAYKKQPVQCYHSACCRTKHHQRWFSRNNLGVKKPPVFLSMGKKTIVLLIVFMIKMYLRGGRSGNGSSFGTSWGGLSITGCWAKVFVSISTKWAAGLIGLPEAGDTFPTWGNIIWCPGAPGEHES